MPTAIARLRCSPRAPTAPPRPSFSRMLAHGFKIELLVASPLRSPLPVTYYSIVILGAARARPFSSVAFTWRAMAR
jgi:hypothetical protein